MINRPNITESRSDSLRVMIAEKVCKALDSSKIPWSITHGAEEYPKSIGRDLDILVPTAHHSHAVALAEKIAADNSWEYCLLPIKWAGSPVLVWIEDDDGFHSFEFHFISDLVWSGCLLARHNSAYNTRIHNFNHSTWPGFCKRVFIQTLAGCWDKFETHPSEMMLLNHEEADVRKELKKLIGKNLAEKYLNLLKEKNIRSLRAHVSHVKYILLIKAITPYSYVKFSPTWFLGKSQRILGITPWAPPLLAFDLSIGECDSLIDDVTSKICMAKSKPYSVSLPQSWQSRFKISWNIRIQRSLFRLIVIKTDTSVGSVEKLANYAGDSNIQKGAIYIKADRASSNEYQWHYYSREFNETGSFLSYSNRDKTASRIASLYMSHLRPMKPKT